MEWASNVCVTLSSKRDSVSSRLSNKINTLCQIKFACSLTLFRHHIMICRSINSWKSKCVTLNKCMALLSLPTTPYYVNTWHWIWAMRQNRPGSKFDQRLVESLNSDEDGALSIVVRRRAPKLHHHPIPAASAPAPRGCASHESPTIKEEPISNPVVKCKFISVSFTD